MVDLILSLILVVMSGARMGEMVGSKVVVQNNLAGRLSEITTYMVSDRRRIEMRSSVPRRNPDGSRETVDRTNVLDTPRGKASRKPSTARCIGPHLRLQLACPAF